MSKKALVLWHGGTSSDELQSSVLKLREEWNSKGTEIFLEHVERLVLVGHSKSSFDVVLCGVIPPSSFIHDEDFLEELIRIMKPSGSLILKEPVYTNNNNNASINAPLRTLPKLLSTIKFSGFVEVEQSPDMSPADERVIDYLTSTGINVQSIKESITIANISAKTPSYQSGASSMLSFGSRTITAANKSKAQSNVAQIWSLSDTVDGDLLLDSDTLLTEDDLMRPDPTSLTSACGPGSGKKKACKNCTCGLADEGNNSNNTATTTVTSSCGSCYLGDAFRCASCPYLGMPAFKPGEQVKLSDRQLHADQ